MSVLAKFALHEEDESEDGEDQLKDSGPADIVFHGGSIFTLDDQNPQVEALAVKGKRILEVGNYSQIKSKIQEDHTEIVDLKGMTLLPGFIEAHTHATLLAVGSILFGDIAAYSFEGTERTKDEIIAIIKKKISDYEADTCHFRLPWCMYAGWDIELIPELPRLTADYIDKEFTSKYPLIIFAQSGHAAWVNHKMFEVCNITYDTPDPKGGRYDRDPVKKELTGLVLEEPAISPIVNRCPKGSVVLQAYDRINKIWREYSSRGYTTVTEMAYSPNIGTDIFLSLKACLKDCPIRLALYSTGGKDHKLYIRENSKLWLAGYKFWADGSPHAGTSAAKDNYLDNELTRRLSFPEPPNKGTLNWSNDDLSDKVKECHDLRKQVAIHARTRRESN